MTRVGRAGDIRAMFMPRRNPITSLTILTLALFLVSACSQSEQAKSDDDRQFTVVDSLLGERFDIVPAGISVKPPVGWSAIPDSIREQMSMALVASSPAEGTLRLQNLFLDTLNASGLMICTVEGMSIAGDTGSYLANLRNSLVDHYGQDSIKTDEFHKAGILIKQMTITDAASIQFELVCFLGEHDAVEILYYMPRENYPDLAARLESSIGSIRPL